MLILGTVSNRHRRTAATRYLEGSDMVGVNGHAKSVDSLDKEGFAAKPWTKLVMPSGEQFNFGSGRKRYGSRFTFWRSS